METKQNAPGKRIFQLAIHEAISSKLSLNSCFKREYDKTKRCRWKTKGEKLVPDEFNRWDPLVTDEMAEIFKSMQEEKKAKQHRLEKNSFHHQNKFPNGRGRGRCLPVPPIVVGHIKSTLPEEKRTSQTEVFNSFNWPSQNKLNPKFNNAISSRSLHPFETTSREPIKTRIESRESYKNVYTSIDSIVQKNRVISEQICNVSNKFDYNSKPSNVTPPDEIKSLFANKNIVPPYDTKLAPELGRKIFVTESVKSQGTFLHHQNFEPVSPLCQLTEVIKSPEVEKHVNFKLENDAEFLIPPPHPLDRSVSAHSGLLSGGQHQSHHLLTGENGRPFRTVSLPHYFQDHHAISSNTNLSQRNKITPGFDNSKLAFSSASHISPGHHIQSACQSDTTHPKIIDSHNAFKAFSLNSCNNEHSQESTKSAKSSTLLPEIDPEDTYIDDLIDSLIGKKSNSTTDSQSKEKSANSKEEFAKQALNDIIKEESQKSVVSISVGPVLNSANSNPAFNTSPVAVPHDCLSDVLSVLCNVKISLTVGEQSKDTTKIPRTTETGNQVLIQNEISPAVLLEVLNIHNMIRKSK